MRDEYDFSKGERGKFFHKNTKTNLPIYLDDDMISFVEGIAQKRKMDVSTVVNILLRSDKQLSDAMN